MLQPSDIRRYKAPDYHEEPPSHSKQEPSRLPFKCIVVDSVDASLGGLPPSLLFRLRKLGCSLVLARCTDSASPVVEDASYADQERRIDPMLGNKTVTYDEMCGGHKNHQLTDDLLRAHWANLKPETKKIGNKLHEEWFDAVFDEVIEISERDVSSSSQTDLEKYLEDEDLSPEQVVCFASTVCGARVFAAIDAGLIVCPTHSLVQAGADVAMGQSPSVRLLAWFHQMYVNTHWCTCMWAVPAENEFLRSSYRCDAPSMEERAELSAVASSTLTALGHPPWVNLPGCCQVRSAGHTMPCPDWTRMEPVLIWPDGGENDIGSMDKMRLYCHSLDVGIGQVNHALEVHSRDGSYLRVSSNRIVNKFRKFGAAAELCVTLDDYNYVKKPPKLCIRSKLAGSSFDGKGMECFADEFHEKEYRMIRHCVESGKAITVTVWHRLFKDQGRGEVQIDFGPAVANREAFLSPKGTDGIEISIDKPLRGTRYIVHKIVSVRVFSDAPSNGLPLPSVDWQKRLLRLHTSTMTRGGDEKWEHAMFDSPPRLSDLKGEHRAQWRMEWDQADIVIVGARQAALCQRAARLFRFHQVSRFVQNAEDDWSSSVPQLVMESLKKEFDKFFVDHSKQLDSKNCELTNPSVLVNSLLQKVPEAPEGEAKFRIWPGMPPTCSLLEFNVAIGQGWYRLTFTSGVVKVLRQGPALEELAQGLAMDIDEDQVTKFLIPIAGDEGVIIQPSPWQEVKVDYALTDLGKPDGGAGGFYGVMRQTRLVRANLVWRYWHEGSRGFQSALINVLRVAEKRLQSIPRPPKWKSGPSGDKFVHTVMVDSDMRVRVNLTYEKRELDRDITFVTLGEDNLKRKMQKQHEKMFQTSVDDKVIPIMWIDGKPMPSWSELEEQAIETLENAASAQSESSLADCEQPFANFITDRDGTTNNYCDRYASSVQSAYNALMLMRFAHHCAKNSMYITAAPLGGRPQSEGLMELSVMRHGAVTYAGSKGREYYDNEAQKVCELEPLNSAHQELLEDLYQRLAALCAKPENTKFLGIGSGLQQKYGEITLARNDPNRSIPEPESKRFMADVRAVKLDLDPEGSLLDLHDTGTDMELFPRDEDGTRAVFDKGQGVIGLNEKLKLNVAQGPNLVCGDTDSDVKMIEAALELMHPHSPVELYDAGDGSPSRQGRPTPALNFVPLSRSVSHASSFCSQDGSSAPLGSNSGSPFAPPTEVPRCPLAVLFVISPEQHEKSKNLASRIREMCEEKGAFCTILPSPDLLVWSLAGYAKKTVMRAFEQDGSSISKLAKVCLCSEAKLKDAMEVNKEEWNNKDPERFAEEVFNGKYYE